MAKRAHGFSRREQEMMSIIYRREQATAAEVRQDMTAPPSYSSVRSTLSALERKGHLTHRFDGNRYIYRPTVQRDQARQTALDHLLTTFFDDSAADVVTALLASRRSEISEAELDELSKLIEQTRRAGR